MVRLGPWRQKGLRNTVSRQDYYSFVSDINKNRGEKTIKTKGRKREKKKAGNYK